MSQLNNYASNVSNFLRKVDKNTIYVSVTVIAIIAAAVLIFERPSFLGLSNEAIAKKAIDYINNQGLSQTPASFVSASSDSGVVKIKIKIGANEFDSYVTRNGKLLFPQAFDMTKTKTASSSGK